MSEFDLEHWRSRAKVAEDERDAARAVLVSLRHYFHRLEEQQPVTVELEPVRNRLREHDQKWWTRDHAVNAVAEMVAGCDDYAAAEKLERAMVVVEAAIVRGEKDAFCQLCCRYRRRA